MNAASNNRGGVSAMDANSSTQWNLDRFAAVALIQISSRLNGSATQLKFRAFAQAHPLPPKPGDNNSFPLRRHLRITTVDCHRMKRFP
ncbi:hypothetical protein [Rhizobium leguminosarum]|uniref:hypothetical protein n=1 Tax=Rhizobium leguminosarum TaxID=384 RepID=UPI000CF511E5|nr:hypothetical protein [Rhizobium leguminosarum]